MKKIKKLLHRQYLRLRTPSMAVFCVSWVLTLVAATGAILLMLWSSSSVFTYVIYATAALSLGYSVYAFVRLIPSLKQRIGVVLHRHRRVQRLLEDHNLKTTVSYALSLVLNLGFVVFHTVVAICEGLVWYGAVAGYYFLLCLLKGWLFAADHRIRKANRDTAHIARRSFQMYGFCGGALIVLTLGMTGVVALTVMQRKPVTYSAVVAIAFAAYTVYKTAFSIVHALRARVGKSMSTRCFRNIGLAETALSVVSLQMALVSTFSHDASSMALLNGIVGFVACVFTLGMGVWMVTRAIAEIKCMQKQNGG